MIPEGTEAPGFSLPDADGKIVKLSDFAGKTVILYFYPKDDTPGCTTEACGFRDTSADFAKHGAVILGISPDDSASHAKFAKKHKLPFTLLADVGAKVAKDYGVWGEKKFMGKQFMGIDRTTFIIAPDGEVEKVFKNVKAEGHNKEVLEWLDKNKE